MLIYSIKNVVLFTILIGNFCEFGLANLASANDILELAECYKQFKYGQNVDAKENKQLGLEMDSENKEQMKKIMDKHFGIILFFENCLKGLQKNNLAFEEFQKEIFEKSEMSEWLKFVIPFLEDEYNKIRKEEKKTFKVWRRMLIPHGLLVEAFYFGFAKNLLDKVMAKFPSKIPKIREHNLKLVENLEWISKRMGEEAETNMSIAELSFLQQFTTKEFLKEKSIEDFIAIFKKMKNLIRNSKIEWNLNEAELLESTKYNLPKVKRVIWIFRHAHRYDNGLNDEKDEKKAEMENKKAKMRGEESAEDEALKKEDEKKKKDEEMKKNAEEKEEKEEVEMSPDLKEPYKVYGRTFGKDNSPLSEKGKEMAAKMEPILAVIPVKHIYASPFERTVDTAGLLLGQNHPGLKIRLEPGLLESLHKSKGVPTFLDCEELQKFGHGRLDCDYKPKYGKEKLMNRAKEVEIGDRDDACVIRAEKILARIVKAENNESTSSNKTEVATNKGQNVDDQASHSRHEHQGEKVGGHHLKSKGTAELEKEGEKGKWGKAKEWIAPGEENAEHIVLVSHATLVLATEQYFEGKYKYVPQLSITKLVELEENGEENEKMGKEENVLKNVRMVYGSESKHLADENGHQMHLFKH